MASSGTSSSGTRHCWTELQGEVVKNSTMHLPFESRVDTICLQDGVYLLPAKRKNLLILICRESNKHDCLRKAQVLSIEKFIFAANICKNDCFDRLFAY